MKMKIVLSVILCMLWVGQTKAERVTFEFSDGVNEVGLKSKMEQAATALLSEINTAQTEGRSLSLANLSMTGEAKSSISMLWENVPFRCEDTEVVTSCLSSNGGYQARFIPIRMVPNAAERKTIDADELVQQCVICFSTAGVITNFYISLNDLMYAQMFRDEDGKEVADTRRRLEILDYVEHFRTAYNQKDINFLDQIFSEDALIITGTVITTRSSELSYVAPSIRYKRQGKQEYLANLKRCFAKNNYINVKFDDISVTVHPTRTNYYGVTLHQKWNSSTYSDEGILFLLWDFTDDKRPIIHVRTWQPDYLDKAKTQKIPENEIFTLSDFDL